MRTPIVLLLVLVALAATASAASATVTSVYTGAPSRTLTATSDENGDSIAVTCPGSSLLVNGADPTSGALPCSGASSAGTLVVNGNGGTDTVDVTGISELATVTVTVDGGDGDDDLRGVSLASNGYVVT